VLIIHTNCLRMIRNAWHFYYALRLVFKVVCGGIGIGIGIALLTPLHGARCHSPHMKDYV
ncbi:hypothetical protein, partial [Vibrio tasmaniensis]|uniref:hypothetical protein n=1 Tax=Vibrio tasmaniensis TaxID=212663 RepID=UPI00322050C6